MEMQMPTPGPEHEILAKMAGEWIGDETMFASAWCPEEKQSHGHLQTRVLDGFFVISDYEQKMADQITFRGHGVYSVDPESKEYLMYWFDSLGGAGGVARGHYEGNQLTFLNTSPMGHHRYRYTFGDASMRFEMAISQDGENWNDMMDARYCPA